MAIDHGSRRAALQCGLLWVLSLLLPAAAAWGQYADPSEARVLFLPLAASLHDVVCLSDVLRVRVLELDPLAAPAGNPVPITQVEVEILETYHRRGANCTPHQAPAPAQPIPGLGEHVVRADSATLRFPAGLHGSGPYQALRLPRGAPYFFSGQQLFLILPEAARRPLAFEIGGEDEALFDAIAGARVRGRAGRFGLDVFELIDPGAVEPPVGFFLARRRDPALARVYPDPGAFERRARDLGWIVEEIRYELEADAALEEPADARVSAARLAARVPASEAGIAPIQLGLGSGGGVWGRWLGGSTPPGEGRTPYPAAQRPVWDSYALR